MTDEWNAHASGWDDNPAAQLYADRAFASLRNQTGFPSKGWASMRVLDFGCGTGLLAQKVAPHVAELVAVDTAKDMIAVLERKEIPNVLAICADVLAPGDTPPPDLGGRFDLIYASSVCSFLPDYEAAVKSLAIRLRLGGRFIQWDRHASEGDALGLAPGRMRTALAGAGFTDIQVAPAFTLDAGGETMPVLMGTGCL